MSRVTLTGKFTRIDGTPATGTVRVTPSRSPIMDSAGRVVISGPQSFPVQSGGLLEVEIPASNDPDLGPAFTYRIEVILDHASWKISKVWIPHGSTTVDLSEIGDYEPVPGVATRVVTIPADGTDGQVLVWDGAGFIWMDVPAGPQGPPGEVTTAALTTALASKVTGTGMTLRHETTRGERVLLDHPDGTTMIYGDTGWRVITSWDESGTVTGTPLHAGLSPTGGVAGKIAVRRVLDQVSLLITGVTVTSADVAIAMPWGFQPAQADNNIRQTVAVSNTAFGVMFAQNASVFLRMNGAVIASNTGVGITFESTQAWPAAPLPGTPL